ncbi:unnamed protein product [Sphacelaria rigidula]
MVNVVNKRCGHEGCSKRPSYGAVGSRHREFCAQHAGAGMVNVISKKCDQKDPLNHIMRDLEGTSKMNSCREHAVEMGAMPNMSAFGHEASPLDHDLGESRGGGAIHGRESTLEECNGIGIDASGGVRPRLEVRENCSHRSSVLPVIPGKATAESENISTKEAGMKLELVVSPRTRLRSGGRRSSERSVSSASDCRCSTNQRGPKRRRTVASTVSRSSVVETGTVVDEGKRNVKLEVAPSHSSPPLV